MIKKWYIIALIIFCIESPFFGLYACMITFINDSHGAVLIHNKNEGTSFILNKNERRRFGSSDKHTNFDVCVKQSRPALFRILYACQQNACGKTGNPQIKFSDLEKGQGAAQLFTIIKNEAPATSMVRELPMIQQKNL